MTVFLRGLLGLGMLAAGLALGLYMASARDGALTACDSSTRPAFVADRLYFGRAPPDGGLVSEEAWEAFLHDVVTPHFPERLTVWRAEGQWTDPRGQLVREPVVVLEVVHPAGPRADASLAAIARE